MCFRYFWTRFDMFWICLDTFGYFLDADIFGHAHIFNTFWIDLDTIGHAQFWTRPENRKIRKTHVFDIVGSCWILFDMFCYFWILLDTFGHVWTRLDMFGYVFFNNFLIFLDMLFLGHGGASTSMKRMARPKFSSNTYILQNCAPRAREGHRGLRVLECLTGLRGLG